MSDVDEAMQRLQAEDNVIGCAIVTRDGLPGQVRFNQAHDPEGISAMSAAVLAAAEAAVTGLEQKQVERVVIHGGSTTTLLEGLSQQHILVLVASSRLGVDEIVALAAEAKQGLKVLNAS